MTGSESEIKLEDFFETTDYLKKLDNIAMNRGISRGAALRLCIKTQEIIESVNNEYDYPQFQFFDYRRKRYNITLP